VLTDLPIVSLMKDQPTCRYAEHPGSVRRTRQLAKEETDDIDN
jgi:hypothetical protein